MCKICDVVEETYSQALVTFNTKAELRRQARLKYLAAQENYGDHWLFLEGGGAQAAVELRREYETARAAYVKEDNEFQVALAEYNKAKVDYGMLEIEQACTRITYDPNLS